MKKGNLSSNKIAIINIISTFILQGIAFLTIPIFFGMLGKEQFGDYSICYSWMTILSCVMGLCIYSSISTGHLDFEKEYYKFRSSIFSFGLFVSILLIVLGILAKELLADFTGYQERIVIFILFGALGQYVLSFVESANIYEKKAWQNLMVSLSLSISTVVLSIILIKRADADFLYVARLKGTVIPYMIISIICAFLIINRGRTLYNKKYCKYGVMLGIPIVFHLLAGNILSQSDRVMMKSFGVSTGDIGIYSLFYSLSTVLSIVLRALNNAWCPFYYDDVKAKRLDVIKRKSKSYIELFSVASVGFIMLCREVGLFMGGKEGSSGLNILPILVFVVYFSFMYQFPVNYEFYNKKTYLITIATVVSGVINIILNAIMIPLWGYWGAAIATAISYACLFVIHFVFVKVFISKEFHTKVSDFAPGVVALLIASAGFYLLADYWIIRWGLGFLLGVVELIRIYKRKSIF